MKRLALIALLSGACDLPALEVVGRKCDASRACGGELFCVDGECRVDGPAPFDGGLPFDQGLLFNQDFEQFRADASIVGWRGSGRLVSSTLAHEGLRSARMISNGQFQVLTPLTGAAPTELGMLFCSSMWVRTDSDAGAEVSASLREHYEDGGVETSAGNKVTQVRTNWVELNEQFVAFGRGFIDVRIIGSRLDAGESYFIDDVVVWRPDGGHCP